jgi:protein TonB
MAAKSNINSFFTLSGCLSPEGIKRYIEGKHTPEETRLLDDHIASCELCSDAVSGFKQYQNPETAMSEVMELNRQLQNRFHAVRNKKSRERTMVTLFSMAATVILLVGLFYLLRQREFYKERIIAENIADTHDIQTRKPIAHTAGTGLKSSAQPEKSPLIAKEEKRRVPDLSEKKLADVKNLREEAPVVILERVEISEEAKTEAEALPPEKNQEDVTTILQSRANGKEEKRQKIAMRTESASPAGQKSAFPIQDSTLVEPEEADHPVETAEEIYNIVEENPKFRGGDISRFSEYVNKNIVYPPEAAKSGTGGKVMVSFVIDENGKLTDVKIIRSAGSLFDQEALRVITSSPAWNAGKQGGKPVKVRVTIPVVFSPVYNLNQESTPKSNKFDGS